MENGEILRVRLDGTINSDSYAELENVFARQSGANGRTIILDMAGVEFMNDEAARNLIKLRSERVRIINCSPFIVMLLETFERQSGKS
jgi:anti-anti-sigma regulatory factor